MAELRRVRPLARVLLDRVPDPKVEQELRAGYEALVERTRRERPGPGSDEELEVLAAALRLRSELVASLGSEVLASFRAHVKGQLAASVRVAIETASTMRKLALRQVQDSVAVAIRVVHDVGLDCAAAPNGVPRTILDADVASIVASLPRVSELRRLLGSWLSLTMALECIDGELDDLTYWSRRAIEDARRMEGILPRLSLRLAASGASLGEAQWAPAFRDPAEGAWERAFEYARAHAAGRGESPSDPAADRRRWYQTLELPPGADREAVQRAFDQLRRQYDPDAFASEPGKHRAATEVTKRLTEAYEGLLRHLDR